MPKAIEAGREANHDKRGRYKRTAAEPSGLARELKAIEPKLPIFLLTADCDAETEKKALASGITAVFSKCDDLATLVDNARAVCGLE